MTAVRTLLPLRLYEAGVLVGAGLVGVLAALQPHYGVAAAIGLAFVGLTLSNLTVGLCLFTVVAFLEALPGYFGGVSFAKVMGLLLALSWVATATVRQRDRQITGAFPVATALLALLALWIGMSTLWAEDSAVAIETTQRWVLNLALFPIVFAALRRPNHLEWLLTVFVGGALLSALLGGTGVLETESAAADDSGRLGGAGINANQLGGALIAGAIFAVALGSRPRRLVGERALLFLTAGICAVTLFATVSRGSMLGLAVALAAAPFVLGRGRRVGAIVLLVAVTLGGVGYFTAIAPDAAVQRIVSEGPDDSSSGRIDIWRVGWRMVEGNAVKGVGVGNFQEASVHYLLEPGQIVREEFIIDKPKVAHNIYLHVLAELGAVGLGLFLALVGFCLWCSVVAARIFERRGERGHELLARGLLLATLGLLAADFFSSGLLAKQLWLLLAAAPATLVIARSGAR